MPFLQDIIHKFEEGGGMRYVRWSLGVLAMVLLVAGYNLRAFHNMSNQEAMDAAQVGRHIAEGKGFTTSFIRPFSIFLVKRFNLSKGIHEDPAQLKTDHPDLANPPVYPLLLAGLMKVTGMKHEVILNKRFWSAGGAFLRYKPDFLIAVMNQVFFLVAVYLAFLLARRLFDPAVAWVSTVILLCTEVFWKFTVSGLSTSLLMLLVIALAWLLVLLEQESREPKRGTGYGLLLAGGIGAVLAAGALTRYSLGWLIVPGVLFIALFGGRQRVTGALLALAVFAAMVLPWLVRNYAVSGTPLGLAGYTLMENSQIFPGYKLQRSLEPNYSAFVGWFSMFMWHKLFLNLKPLLQDELPRLGGNWIAAFFLVGLLISFRGEAARRLRYFLLGALVLLIFVQAMSRTMISETTPDINGENLLILLLPLITIYGVSLFFLLLDQLELQLMELRYLVIGVFALIACLPMFFVYLPPKPFPVVFPPYDPGAIQTVAGWMKPNELIMSDIPWAVAWYGGRQSVWLTLRVARDPEDPGASEDFFALNDYIKPVKALYLTPVTIDRKFISEYFSSYEESWGRFLLQTLVEKRVPQTFPLGYAIELPAAVPMMPKPDDVQARLDVLNRQINLLANKGRQILEDPKVSAALEESPESAKALRTLVALAEPRDFPLGSAPVASQRQLEQIIMRGQLILTDYPRWNRQ